MKKNKLTKLALLILLTILIPTKVQADDPTLPSWWFEQETEMQALQQRINDLESQLNAATSRPVATPRPQHPNIRLVQPQSLTLTPGEVRDVNIEIRNIGNGQASNVLVTASTNGPVSIEFINNSNIVGNMGQNSGTTVRTRITVDPNATADTHDINLEFAFRNRDGNNETSTDRISARINTQSVQARVILQNFTVNRTIINPGDTFVISAQLANLGEGIANNVQATISEGLNAEGIYLSGSPNTPFLQSVEAGHQSTQNFTLTASNRLTSGTFPLIFEVVGKDHAGEDISEQFKYFITVVAPAEGTNRAIISTNNISISPETVGVNQQATVSMYLTNTGNLTARNIRITATPAEIAAIVPQSANVQTISRLQPGESHFLSFTFSPTANANSQYHMIGFEAVYDIGIPGEVETDTFDQFIGIKVNNPDKTDADRTSRPRMLVSSYEVDPVIVSAGSEFDLSLAFQNTSATQTVTNVKITLRAIEPSENHGAVFTPVGSSNTLFIDKLAPNEIVERDLRMFVVPDANPRTYSLEVYFDYEDENFNELTEIEQININVKQFAQLEISHLNLPEHGMMFQPIVTDFNIINSGRVALANLRVAVEGNFETSGIDIFVGNMGRGNSTNFTGQFSAYEPGEQQGVLIISGEDAAGALIESRHEFVIFVDEMGGFGDEFLDGGFDEGYARIDERGEMMVIMGMDMEESGTGSIPWLPIIGGLVAVGIATATAIIIRKRKRNKQDMFEELQ